ncbi:NirD/YgiW/YdeI family stress tolerance protein [Burkholderia orbicola]|uniref:YgiW/YdeI family stress tolerance OB fold protein n=1 Tax=Burkholderia orbicola TaxID=2978683 RepID=UPI00264C0716|nr:NirD/YgiW/YdeI family stress tolerance protein [Burkholderia orbicola]MDN7995458.1 NirD/YgiW/YdeI family stress tolerance protein [Burkholderia orbicola]
MRYAATILSVVLVVLPVTVCAQYTGPYASTATSVKNLIAHGRDDQPVQLTGRIVRHVGGEYYEFADATGTIEVEIDDKVWVRGQPVNHTNEVRLTGELERKWSGRARVDVDRIDVVR